ncbi:DUF779 domain-containing protein [Epibacterium sp. SM1969]|uniref:DUF779 domain-containing protein n=1 Tax=Tritonibacter aquimaris TaxID=2663379 RepID=A0A844ALD0_9RHOB|nr:DUF779 domain-containing protein [Tritonibacter aquimaris]MQY42595.1 DUF779 domain-containing protein [Tritonibacter aquimaris]
MAEQLEKVVITEAGRALLAELRAEHGNVVFQLSAGCCDGTGAMCFTENSAFIGTNDVKLGEADGAGVWASPSIAGIWENSQLIIDAGPGSGDGFSLDNGRTTRFLTKARIISPSA